MWKIYGYEENDVINLRYYVLCNNRSVLRLVTSTSFFSQKIRENWSGNITSNGQTNKSPVIRIFSGSVRDFLHLRCPENNVSIIMNYNEKKCSSAKVSLQQYSWLWAFSTDNCVNKGWDGYLVDFSGLLMHNISKREKKNSCRANKRYLLKQRKLFSVEFTNQKIVFIKIPKIPKT